MEQITQPKKEMLALETQIRECFGRVVYSTKTHEKCADLCVARLRRIKVLQIILSALTTSGLVTAILGEPKVSRIAMIFSAIISAALLIAIINWVQYSIHNA